MIHGHTGLQKNCKTKNENKPMSIVCEHDTVT